MTLCPHDSDRGTSALAVRDSHRKPYIFCFPQCGGSSVPGLNARSNNRQQRPIQPLKLVDRHNMVQPKFSSWGKTVLWQVIDVEPITVFGMFKNG